MQLLRSFDVVMFSTSVILSINAQKLNIKAMNSFEKKSAINSVQKSWYIMLL